MKSCVRNPNTSKLQLKNRKCYYCTKSLKAQKFHPETPSCSFQVSPWKKGYMLTNLPGRKHSVYTEGRRMELHTMGVTPKSVVAYEIF